jgi:hypothetical protein
VSHICPGFHGLYTIPAPDKAPNHTPEFADAAGTEEAHRLTILTSKGLAGTAWRVLVDDEFAKRMKRDFEKDREDSNA